MILKAGQEVLGMLTGRRPQGDKDSWWWNEEVTEAIRATKEAKSKWATSRRQEDRDSYRQANKAAKKEVTRSKAQEVGNIRKARRQG